MIIVLKKKQIRGYLLAEVLIELILFCTLTSLFFSEQHVLVKHENKQIEELKEVEINLNVTKKMLIVGYDNLSGSEKKRVDEYKIQR